MDTHTHSVPLDCDPLWIIFYFVVAATTASIKLRRRANTAVLGTPLKMLRPVWPGRNRFLCQGSSTTCFTNAATCLPSGNSNAQNGVETHCGTTRVPSALVTSACLRKRGIRCMGGHHQLFSPPHWQVNVSTASVPGYQ